jgi:3-deoxy-7-phosphoheptulonate synthase
MLVQLHAEAPAAEVRQRLQAMGLWTRDLKRDDGSIGSIEIKPGSAPVPIAVLQAVPGVREVHAPASLHPHVDRARGRSASVQSISFDGKTPVLIAGPCAIESEEAIHKQAQIAAEAGATMLRGGAYKPRTSPHAFSGHGEIALGWMRSAASSMGLAMLTEVLSERTVDLVASHADMLQIGSRNMQNFALLDVVGQTGLPVLLKRSRGASIEEWLLAGEHLFASGSETIVFCERGIQGFDRQTRNLLDVGAIAILRHELGLPVIADPSHATGRRDLVVPLANAAVVAGAHGVMVEFSEDPGNALSDGPQAISPADLAQLGEQMGLREGTP